MPPNPAWEMAFRAALTFSRQPRKADEMVAEWPLSDPAERRRAHRLFYAFLRHRGTVQEHLSSLLRRPPRARVTALLELTGSELCLRETAPALIVHDAVRHAKAHLGAPEVRLVNAVLRRLSERLEDAPATPRSSHPRWLVDRWERQWGEADTRALLEWNQHEPETWVRWHPGVPVPPALEAAPWEHFFLVTPAVREIVHAAAARGEAYLQDPFTRHPIELLAPSPQTTVLDLCAAPGGKTRALLEHDPAGPPPLIVAIDLPGPRLDRLRQNLAHLPTSARVEVRGADLRTLTPAWFEDQALPPLYDRVLLDVPCSNTGVIRRRPDVRWVLQPRTLEELPRLQAELLDAAARCVRPGGILVYSTCSLEREENEAVIEAFLLAHPEFRARPGRRSFPWRDRHDGGGAFPLLRDPS